MVISACAPAEEVNPICLGISSCRGSISYCITNIVILVLCKTPSLGAGLILQIALGELNLIVTGIDGNKSSSAWMPNIDCMTLLPKGTTERVVVGINAPVVTPADRVNDGKYYTLDGKLVRHPQKHRLYIYNGRKVLMQ